MRNVAITAGALLSVAGFLCADAPVAAAQSNTPAVSASSPAAMGQAARQMLQPLVGQELSGCYHWKKKDCYSADLKAKVTTASGILTVRTPSGSFQFRPTAGGGMDLKTPLWEPPLPLVEVTRNELVFARPKSEMRVRFGDGTLDFTYLYGEVSKTRAYGYALKTPGAGTTALAAVLGTGTNASAGTAPSARPAADQPAAAAATFAAIDYSSYNHLKPTDANRYLMFNVPSAAGRGPYYLTVFSCAPGVDLRVKGGRFVRRDVRIGDYYVTTAVHPNPGRKFNYEIDAGSDSTVGFPYYLVGQAGSDAVDPQHVAAEAPYCDKAMPDDNELARRFGDYFRALGKSVTIEGEHWVHDYQWLNRGFAIRSSCRTRGKDDGWEWCHQYSYDRRKDQIFKTSIYQPGNPTYLAAGTRMKTGVVGMAWRSDIAQARAAGGGGGGGLGGILKGALAGAAGMAMGSPATAIESAVAGAVAGAALGAMGNDAEVIGTAAAQGSAQGTQEFEQSQAELRAESDRVVAAANEAAERERAAQAAEEERRASEAARKQEATQAEARQQLAITLGQADAFRAQELADARARGDVAAQQRIEAQAAESRKIAQQFGIEDQVRDAMRKNQAEMDEAARTNRQWAAANPPKAPSGFASDGSGGAAAQVCITQNVQDPSKEHCRTPQPGSTKGSGGPSSGDTSGGAGSDKGKSSGGGGGAGGPDGTGGSRTPGSGGGGSGDSLVVWKEGVAVCERDGPDSWACKGPRDASSFYKTAEDNLKVVCKNARFLDEQGGYRIYGCGYGISPTDKAPFRESHHFDWIKALGLSSPPGRRTYRCPAEQYGACLNS